MKRLPRRAVWSLFAFFLVATLAASVLLQRLMSPIGNAVITSVQERDRQLSGLLVAGGTDRGWGRYALYDGVSYHPVNENGHDLSRFAGHRVRIQGLLDDRTGQLELTAIRTLE